jgi:uncharacterized RDD family membrane protein YckC
MPQILAPLCWTQVVDLPPSDDALARWPRRALSAVIDLFVISAITLPFVAPTISRIVDSGDGTTELSSHEFRTIAILNIVVQVAYFTGMHAWRGQTVGKIAARTVVVRDDGQPLTGSVAFVRAVTLIGINFVSGLLFIVPAVVNMLRPLWQPRRQTWHDQVARTVVARVDALPRNLTE